MGMGGAEVIIILLILGVFIAIACAICAMFMMLYSACPPAYRRMSPGMVWLMLIPCFGYVWTFFVVLRLSDSYKDYFYSQQQFDVGTCNRGMGLAYAICSACGLIPYLGSCIAFAGLILMIIYLVQMFGLRRRILDQAAVHAQHGMLPPPPGPPPGPPPSLPPGPGGDGFDR